MGFIPDRGVSSPKKDDESSVIVTKQNGGKENQDRHKDSTSNKQKKKVASYSLETDLIKKVKLIADKKEMYYSTLVSLALKHWIAKNN